MVSVYESLLSKFLNDRSSLSKFHNDNISKLVANDDDMIELYQWHGKEVECETSGSSRSLSGVLLSSQRRSLTASL